MASRPSDLDHTHLGLFYASDRDYVAGVLRFATPAVERGEPVAAAVPGDRAALLESALREAGATPEVFDMTELGRNPARIIPAVQTMLARHGGRRLHYISESIWAGRSPEEIAEATRHEALINLAWPGADIRVLCPYDTSMLDPAVLQDAQRTHPHVIVDGVTSRGGRYHGPSIPLDVDRPLPPPPGNAAELDFGLEELVSVRALVSARATIAGLATERVSDLVLAVNEVATNTVSHGAGHGVAHVWSTPHSVVCQVEDSGHITDPLAGRRTPEPDAASCVGLWTVNQLCDLVEVRTSPVGTVVRVHSAL